MRDHIIATMRRQSESRPPPKRRRIAHFQADASSSPSAPSSDLNPSPPFLDPPAASDLSQSPGYARAIPSGHSVNDILLNLHARTHRATDERDDDFEDALEGDAAEAAESIGSGTDDPWSGEDVDTEDEVDPREGEVSDSGILAVGTEELGKSKHYLLHTP